MQNIATLMAGGDVCGRLRCVNSGEGTDPKVSLIKGAKLYSSGHRISSTYSGYA